MLCVLDCVRRSRKECRSGTGLAVGGGRPVPPDRGELQDSVLTAGAFHSLFLVGSEPLGLEKNPLDDDYRTESEVPEGPYALLVEFTRTQYVQCLLQARLGRWTAPSRTKADLAYPGSLSR